MKYYAKLGYNDRYELVLQKFTKAGLNVTSDDVLMDRGKRQKRPDSAYTKLKDELAVSHESLCIDSLFSLGKNAREITKELGWFKDHDVRVCVLDIPASMDPDASKMDLLYEVNQVYASREVENLKAGQRAAARKSQKAGRPPLPYPPDWEELYYEYRTKEITLSEILEKTGLSKGTFYNMQRRYLQEQREARRDENHHTGFGDYQGEIKFS